MSIVRRYAERAEFRTDAVPKRINVDVLFSMWTHSYTFSIPLCCVTILSHFWCHQFLHSMHKTTSSIFLRPHPPQRYLTLTILTITILRQGRVKMRGGLQGRSRTLWKCGADLPTNWSVCGAIVRTCGSMYLDKRGYLLTYLLISLKWSCGLYESTELPINQSINRYIIRITYPTDLRICTRICGAVHTDLRVGFRVIRLWA